MATFRVATWNLENLLLPDPKSGQDGYGAYVAKIESLAQVIEEIDPHVIAVQEVGGDKPLSDLRARLRRSHPYRKMSSYGDKRGIRVAFLSKVPIDSSDELELFPAGGLASVSGSYGGAAKDEPKPFTRMGRGALSICVQPVPGTTVRLVTCHLKSKMLSYPSTGGRTRFEPHNETERVRAAGLALLQRTAEAVAVRAWANGFVEGNNTTRLILLGDMNDEPEAATTQILLGPSGSEICTPGFDKPDKGDDVRLFNLTPLIPERHRYSRLHEGQPELIDHILVSEEMLPGRPRRLPVVDTGVELVLVPSIGNNPTKRLGEPGSDHAPVIATFEL